MGTLLICIWDVTYYLVAPFLYHSYIKCLDTLKTREKKFMEFSARFNPDIIKRWDAVDDTPKTVGNEVINVH